MRKEMLRLKLLQCLVFGLCIALQDLCSKAHAAELAYYPIAFSIGGKTLASGANFAYEIGDGVILMESHAALFAVKKKAAGPAAMPEKLLEFDEQNPVYLSCTANEERKPLTYITHGNSQGQLRFYDPAKKQLTSVTLPTKPEFEPKTLKIFGDQEAVTIDALSGRLLFCSAKTQTLATVDKKQTADLTHAGMTAIDSDGKKMFFGAFSSEFGILDISTNAEPKLLWLKKYVDEKANPCTPYLGTFSDDGKYIVFVTHNNHLLLIRAVDGELLDHLELARIGEIPDYVYLRMIDSKICIGVNTRQLIQPQNFPQGILPKDPKQFHPAVSGVFAVNVEENKLSFKNGKKFDRVLKTAAYSANCYCVLENEIVQIPHSELYQIVSKKQEPATK